jgi:hypothetical protein
VIFAFVANISLGGLASGSCVEIRHPQWTRPRGIDHVFRFGSLAGMAGIDGFVAWWLISSDSGPGPGEDYEMWRCFTPLSGLVGGRNKLAGPAQLGLVQPPGLTSAPGAGRVPGC